MKEIDNLMKYIPGYDGLYSITKGGKIFCHERKGKKGYWLKIRNNTTYQRVPLYKDGKRTWYAVHRLVAMTYIPNPENKKQVNHKNCNKHDNNVGNLEWVTWKENWEHGRDNGRYRGIMLEIDDQIELARLYSTGRYTIKELSERFNISSSSAQRFIKKHDVKKLAA